MGIASSDYRQQRWDKGIVCSMSRKANCKRPSATASVEVSDAVRQRLRDRARVIRACVEGDGPLGVEAEWDVAGTVTLRVRGERDRTTNECVDDAFGAWTAAGPRPGQRLHVLETP